MTTDQTQRINGKLYIGEDDTRTYLSQPHYSAWGNFSVFESLSAMRRNIAQRLTAGGAHWYYDMYGHWYAGDAIEEVMRRELVLMKLLDRYESLPEFRPKVVKIGQNGTRNHQRMVTLDDLGQTWFWRGDGGNVGFQYDTVLLRDLANPKLPAYGIYWFEDIFALNAEEREAIDRLKKDGNILIFTHAMGYSDWRTLDAANITAITGINIRDLEPDKETAPMAWKADFDHPFVQGIGNRILARSLSAKRFVVDDAAAESIGRFVADDKTAAAIKRHEQWTAIYLPTNYPPIELLNTIAAKARAPVFGGDGINAKSGGRLISIYCKEPEVSGKMRWPGEFSAYDIISKRWYAAKSEFEYTMKRGDTILLFLGTEDETKNFQGEYERNIHEDA